MLERNILEADVCRLLGGEFDAPLVLFQLQVHDLEQPVGGDEGFLDRGIESDQGGEGAGEVVRQGVTRHQLAGGQSGVEHQPQ